MTANRFKVSAVLETGPMPGLPGEHVTSRQLVAAGLSATAANDVGRGVSKLPFVIAAEVYHQRETGLTGALVGVWERSSFRTVTGQRYALKDGTSLAGPDAPGRLAREGQL